jgi:hypothetical protein
MPDSIHPTRLTHQRRTRLCALATLVSGVLVAGCGGSSPSATTAPVASATSSAAAPSANHSATAEKSTATTGGAASSSGSPGPGAGRSGPLAFAECMRANGVPNFPDPNPGRGLLFSLAGVDPSAPAFEAAQTKCQKLMGPGLPFPGSKTHPSAQTMAKLLQIARCMRGHGVPQFPDPQTSVPSHPAGIQEITDFDGAILLFPSTINFQAPAYRQALTACGAPPLGLRH